MPQRTVSIVIDVTGADDASRQVRRVRSAFDDLLGGGQERLGLFARRSREVSQAMKEIRSSMDLREQHRALAGDLEDLFRRILGGARSAGDVWKNIWREIADFFRRTVQEMAAAWATNLGGIAPLGAMGFGSSGIALQGLGPFSGNQLLAGGALLGGLTVGSRSRLVSALGGLGSGALTGFTVGGPLGALVGGIVGGITGLLRGGGGQEKQGGAHNGNRGVA